MSYSIVRLTLYGLISAFEHDLREIIKVQLLKEADLQSILGGDLYKIVERRAIQDGAVDKDEYVEYLDFADSYKILNGKKQFVDETVKRFLKSHNSQLEKLAPIRNRVMHSRPLQFDDFPFVLDLTRSILSYPNYLFSSLRDLESKIREDANFVLSLDVTELEKNAEQQTHNLPLPDFDETGFLGRQSETAALLQACRGPWPVITVVGEGGVGKTALALRVGYELLDDPNNPFEAIVWTSSKTTRLTLNDIEKIDGAIQTSLGVFQDISKTLSGKTSEKALDDVIEHLNTFKILLIIDNLETILDKTITDFLSRLSGSSKILITSRVGIGEFDYRFPLSGMTADDAVQLLRATAQVRRVPVLTKTKQDALRSYCQRMKNNPAFIKWFVSAVQCGKRPEEVLVKPTTFLDFCMSNVYEYLNLDARHIAKSMIAVPGKHAQPVLSYLTGLEGDDFQLALRQLITTNIAVMSSIHTETGYESVYELRELPRLYILKNHAPKREEVLGFQEKKNEIIRIHEKLTSDTRVDRYNVKSIATRTRDDTVVAKYLIDALDSVKADKFEQAFGLIEKAKRLAPAFYEVYRVEAWGHAYHGNYAAAVEAYEIAVELEPNSAPLRYWYGGFLLREAKDAEAALAQFVIAEELDAASFQIKIEKGRCLMYLGRYFEADQALSEVISASIGTSKLHRVAYDSWLQVSLRHGMALAEGGDYVSSLEKFKRLHEKYLTVPSNIVDDKIITSVVRASPYLLRMEPHLRQTSLAAEVVNCLRAVQELDQQLQRRRGGYSEPTTGGGFSSQSVAIFKDGDLLDGVIDKLFSLQKYGFITVDSGGRIFFHYSEVHPQTSLAQLVAGTRVRFQAGESKGKQAARNVIIVSIPARNAAMTGVVKNIAAAGTFGFINVDGGGELFFHQNNLTQGVSIRDLKEGQPVAFEIGQNAKGPVADKIRPSAAEDASSGRVSEVRGRLRRKLPGVPYTYAYVDGVGDVRIHRDLFVDPDEWDICCEGSPLKFVLCDDESGQYGDVVALENGGGN